MAENDILILGGGDHKSGEVDDVDGAFPCARRREGAMIPRHDVLDLSGPTVQASLARGSGRPHSIACTYRFALGLSSCSPADPWPACFAAARGRNAWSSTISS